MVITLNRIEKNWFPEEGISVGNRQHRALGKFEFTCPKVEVPAA
jgi:hypothetical protein